MHISILENEYRHNKRFSDYVDEYCDTYRVTVAEALQDEVVRQVYLSYTEV